MPQRISRPASDEYAEFHQGYIAAVATETDAIAALEKQRGQIEQLGRLTSQQAGHRYAEGKWSVKDLVGHLADTERVLTYRLLRVARGDTTPLPGFDEATVAAGSNAGKREIADLAAELSAVRTSTLALLRSLEEDALARRGTVNNWSLTARGLAFIIAGHFAHHMNVLRDRYAISV